MKDVVATLGNFDGVHIGHQHLFAQLKKWSASTNAKSLVLTFDPHPRAYFTGQGPELITTLEDRLKLIKACGVDRVEVLKFDKHFAELSYQDFLARLFHQHHVRTLCLGPNATLGKNREGTLDKLKKFGIELGLLVHIATPFEMNGRLVSSSQIRQDISEAKLNTAMTQLGRPYTSRGYQVPGRKVGRVLGFPTLNQSHISTILPKILGVYATKTSFDGNTWYKSVSNLGVRPTFDLKEPNLCLETHIYDPEWESIDRENGEIFTQWHDFVREEQKFVDVHQLKAQIQADILKVSSFFSN